ncbi:MAG: nitroreductase family deazaflavin-dependent oxidoreductase [Actinomycetota bacterium]
MSMLNRRPSGARRVFLRAPVYLYRGGLGWLLGQRFLYLVHQGRTTGKRRDTVLEVVHFDERIPEAVVVAAWGTRSDWYRNITASPPRDVWVGRHHWRSPQFRLLEPDEMVAVLTDYGRRHPRSWRVLAPRLGMDREMSPTTARTAAARFPAVAFRPSGSASV